jgi:hypothetical protein
MFVLLGQGCNLRKNLAPLSISLKPSSRHATAFYSMLPLSPKCLTKASPIQGKLIIPGP